jgi:hypothetical protein
LDGAPADKIDLQWFYDLRSRTIAQTMLAMHREQAPIDLATVSERLRREGQLEAVGGYERLNTLPDLAPAAGNFDHWAGILRECAASRLALRVFVESGDTLKAHPEQAQSIARHAAEALRQIGNAADTLADARPFSTLAAPAPDDGNELLLHRFLCRGGGLLLVGQSGQGKSSLAVQLGVHCALGRECFGIIPSHPLRVLLIQAENDEGDMAEMFAGICDGLQLSPDDRRRAGESFLVHSEDSLAGEAFLKTVVEPLVARHKPDLLILDPALAYIGGDTKDAKEVGQFLRRGLNPILHRHGCACLVVHHTTKAKADGPQATHDFLYAGAGSIEFTNWARASLVLETRGNGCYRLHVPKRGGRLRWRDSEGRPTFDRYIRHSRTPGLVCWLEVDPGEVEEAARTGKNKVDLLAHVPTAGPIAQTVLLEKVGASGIGQKKARAFLDELIADGKLHLWLVHRRGTNPAKLVARTPQTEPALEARNEAA